MNARTYRARTRVSWSSRSARSHRMLPSRPSSSCSHVESNFRLGSPVTPVIPEVHIQKRSKYAVSTREPVQITINDAPMMLLPKARVRDSLDYYDRFRRSGSVVADTSVQGLHISTIQSVTDMYSKVPHKSAMKSRKCSISRSETDSGFYSMKRAVTFDNLNQSQNSVYRSDEDSDSLSNASGSGGCRYDGEAEHLSQDYLNQDHLPEHLESFGKDKRVVSDLSCPSRTEGYQQSRWQHGLRSDHDISACEICGVVLSDTDRVKRKFGKVDAFLDWVMSRWGPRKELQYVPRPSYVYRNHAPHFCNFVHQVSLHSRQASAADLTGVPGSELGDEDEYITETTDGRLISKYRKTSSTRASGTEGRPSSPSSNDGDSSRLEDENEEQPIFGIARSGTSASEDLDVRLDIRRDAWENNSKDTEELVVVPSGSDSDNNNRLPSPRQPPPSPEPQKQKKKKISTEIPLPITQKKRGCASKKTKKPLEQGRKMRQIEEQKDVVPVTPEQTSVADTPAAESENIDTPKSDHGVPDLPTNVDKTEKEKTEKSKTKKHLIDIDDDLFKADATDYLNDQMKQSRGDIDWAIMDTNGVEDVKRPTQIKSWIQGRLALSQQSSRFELPMDMKRLEKMTPQEYVKKHCIITSRRQSLYQKIFLKNKEKSQTITFKDLDRSLKDVLVNTITSEQVQGVLHTLDISENTRVDYRLFAGTAAFAERVLYPQFVTEDTHDMPEYQREKIECADFCALAWKLHGVKVNPQMRKLLEQIS